MVGRDVEQLRVEGPAECVGVRWLLRVLERHAGVEPESEDQALGGRGFRVDGLAVAGRQGRGRSVVWGQCREVAVEPGRIPAPGRAQLLIS